MRARLTPSGVPAIAALRGLDAVPLVRRGSKQAARARCAMNGLPPKGVPIPPAPFHGKGGATHRALLRLRLPMRRSVSTSAIA